MGYLHPIFVEHQPRGPRLPVLASLPHSGMYVPDEIASCFTPTQRGWLRNTDWYLQQVYSFLPALGVTVLEATHSRYVVDLNRDPCGDLFGDFWTSVVPERNAHGADVYDCAPASDSIRQRIAAYHEPYHRAIRERLAALVGEFGVALLLDLHSFMGPIENDVCLGDRVGMTCDPSITLAFQAALTEEGFNTVQNQIFSGGYIVKAHGKPPAAHALQIELRYTNYLDCTRIDEPEMPACEEARIKPVRDRLQRAIERVLMMAPQLGLTKQCTGAHPRARDLRH